MASMAQPKMQLLPILLLVFLAMAGATPPGIANHPSHARCKIKKYKHCYNLEHVCPQFCPGGYCTVECVSCKPICVDGSSGPPPVPDSPPGDDDNTPTPTTYTPPSPSTPPTAYTPPPSPPTEPQYPPPTPPTTYTPPPSPPTEPPNPPPSPSTPPTTYTPPPSPPTEPQNPPPSPSTPPTTYTPPSPPTQPQNPPSTPASPPTKYQNPPPSPPSSPTQPENPPSSPTPTYPPTQSHNPPPSPPTQSENPPPAPTPTYPPTQSQNPPPYTSAKTVKCKNKNYPQCYNMKHVCPSSCPCECEVDCVTCKPVCKCDRPGAVCQDPRFIGGDGTTFYFHGKKDQDFCLVSDSNLHINGHFIGKRNENMKRDFTWVQSIAFLFDKNQLFLRALKTSTWDDSIDRLSLTFDGEPVTLPETEGAKWQSANVPTVSITRAGDVNNVIVEDEGNFKITVKVVPITEEDSRIHNYGITKEDFFAHLDLGFKFYSLSHEVNGVLGQTYKPGYVSHLNIGAKMPVMGGDRDFHTSSLFAPDCAVARFTGINEQGSLNSWEMPGLCCGSGIDGRGVVCKR